jgi:hypothetical protein
MPIYDFKQSKRTGYRKLEVPTSRIVVIEGIYALSERLRPLLDLRVSITGGVHFDLVKRVLRDINRSGQGPEEIIQQVRPRPAARQGCHAVLVFMLHGAAALVGGEQPAGARGCCGLHTQHVMRQHHDGCGSGGVWMPPGLGRAAAAVQQQQRLHSSSSGCTGEQGDRTRPRQPATSG